MGAYARVLVGLDLTPSSATQILTRARQLVDADSIDVLHVCDHLHKNHEDLSTGAFANTQALDAAVVRQADANLDQYCRPFGIKHHKVLGGRTADVIHEQARNNVDAIVIGTHGRHGWRLLFGSTPNAVLHGTPCDVLAVHVAGDEPKAIERYERILVALNLEAESIAVMDHAQNIAQTCGAQISACHIVENRSSAMSAVQCQQELAQLGGEYDLDARRCFVREGQVPDQIHQLATELDAQLIVVGTHGKHGLELMLGSTANAVLHGAQCDALSVRVY
jgi:universal stress protein A